LHFEEVTEKQGGEEVRISAICLHYKHTLSAKSSSRTGHLIRHIELCPAKKDKEKTSRSESLLKFNDDGSVVHWEYSPSVARTEFCRMIARLDPPLCFGECSAFQEYITRAHNPRFVKSSRQTTARDLIRLFNDCAEQLINVLKFVSFVALTSDIWSGKAKEDYISVVAHFVNSDWCLENRLLGLRPIKVAHTGYNIVERVELVANDYGITDKIFAIVLDNAPSNKTAMEVLKPVFSGYIGHLIPMPSRNEYDLSAIFLHQRCGCHIINLIVKSCLKPILYAFAFILDPRAKVRGFHKVLQRLSTLNGTYYSRFPSSIRTKLTKMFQIYETKFDGVCLSTQPMPGAGSVKATEAWDDIYGDDETYSTSSGTCMLHHHCQILHMRNSIRVSVEDTMFESQVLSGCN
jgi:hypothetical protein